MGQKNLYKQIGNMFSSYESSEPIEWLPRHLCAAGLSFHKVWGSTPLLACTSWAVENMLPDSYFPVNDTSIREIALKAIFDESGQRQ